MMKHWLPGKYVKGQMRAAFCTVSLSALAKLLVAFFFQQTTKVPESAQIISNLSLGSAKEPPTRNSFVCAQVTWEI
jgi:hypothetical protein